MRSRRKGWGWGLVLGAVSIGGLWSAGDPWIGSWLRAATAQQAASPTRSSPIAITSDDHFVWSVNPDNNSVSVFDVGGDPNQKIAEIPVGNEPWCVAITPDDAKVYVTNMVSGTVSVINTATRRWSRRSRSAPSPSAARSPRTASGSTSPTSPRTTCRLINTADRRGDQDHQAGRAASPTAIAITRRRHEGVRDPVPGPVARPTMPRPLTQTEGADDGREGRVTVIDGVGEPPDPRRHPEPLAKSPAFPVGRQHAGARAAHRASSTTRPGAFPTCWSAILIRGNIAYVPAPAPLRTAPSAST